VKRAFPVVLLFVIALGIWTIRRETKPRVADQPVPNTGAIRVTETSAGTRPNQSQSAQLLGQVILRDYAKTNLPPQNDLTLMSHLMENSLLLLKSAADRPLSANEDWADFLKGKNATHERFLPDRHIALNSTGQLIDRWGTPLFFHALGGGRYEIRSAGPDKILWTNDDIHRNANGAFRAGADLTPSALFPPNPKTAAATKR
jgi:uncharacterized protein YneF (UPF0154 family)